MILTCPSCATRYQADDARFAPPGRNVRCAKCGHVWFQAAAPQELEPALVNDDPATEPDFTPPPAVDPLKGIAASNLGGGSTVAIDLAPKERERARKTSSSRFAQIVGWAALLLLVVGLGWATVRYRQPIANLWPQTASLYAAVGMPVNVRGFELVGVAYKQDFQDGQPVLSVTGKVVNVSNRELPVPEIKVVLTDDAKHELYHWTFDVGVPTLKAGAESPFITRLSSPPPEARNLNVRFADIGDNE